jgi:hypothetical protein
MVLKVKFTEEDIIKSLNNPKTTTELQKSMGCCYRTIWNLLMLMVDNGKVKRKNRCSQSKPVYEYYLAEGIKPIMETKKTLSKLTHSLK